jgi:hypothetical protein
MAGKAYAKAMIQKPKPAPRLTDDERHQRFKDMAREVEVSDRPEDFDKAFDRIIPRPVPSSDAQ